MTKQKTPLVTTSPKHDPNLSQRPGELIFPKPVKRFPRQLRVPNSVLNLLVTEIVLSGVGITTVIGEFESAGMPKHVRMHGEWNPGLDAGTNHYFPHC